MQKASRMNETLKSPPYSKSGVGVLSMATDSTEYDPTYRQQTVDKTLQEFDARISRNEKRWLMAKGALGMLATVKGVDFAIGQLTSFI